MITGIFQVEKLLIPDEETTNYRLLSLKKRVSWGLVPENCTSFLRSCVDFV